MQENAAFNWRTGITLIVFVLALGIYQLRDIFKTYEQLLCTIKVNEQLTIYITEVSKSSLSKDTYNYYLYDTARTANDFLDDVSDLKPIMITDDDKATTEIKDGVIHFHVRGNIYALRTVGYDANIQLDTSPW